MRYFIYHSNYDEVDDNIDDGFTTIKGAARHALMCLPSDDFVYLIGTEEGVDAIVFQGRVYYPKPD